MYLQQLDLLNFRAFKSCSINLLPGLNLLVGENDAGKSAIVDAIKLVLGTSSNEWHKIDEHDFHNDSDTFSITCIFKELTPTEAAFFLEWLSFDEFSKYYLKLTLRARKTSNGRPFFTIYAGADEDSGILQGEAREKLRVTYLKPLRDAEFELTPKRNSRFSQILDSFPIFESKETHELVEIMKRANDEVIQYFGNGQEGSIIKELINDHYLSNFSLSHNPLSSNIKISGNKLRGILEKLELKISNRHSNENLGLGSNNLLFIAAELLLLKKEKIYDGLKLALVEEVEAHLHPQAQLNLITFLEQQADVLGFQSILTTHSNILASKVSINKLTLVKGGCAYSLHESYTKLRRGDYEFLRRFLDATKANLFFANGVLMVEGDAENLLLPILAELLNRPLHKFGVSIVNVSSTALLRYAKVFSRSDGTRIGIPVACIADRDIPPEEAGTYTYIVESGKNAGQERLLIEGKTEADYTEEEMARKEKSLEEKYTDGDVKVFYPLTWTLEYELARSVLRKYLHRAISYARATGDLEREIPPSEVEELFKACDAQIADWEQAGESLENIAVRIYSPLVRKQASKAVTSQIFGDYLIADKSSLEADVLRKDKYLQYLVTAIDYVTLNATND